MTPQRKRRRLWEAEYAAARVEVMARARGGCEFPGCDQRATQVHHRVKRSHPSANHPTYLMALCDPHHDRVHANPAESYENGWLLHYEEVPA